MNREEVEILVFDWLESKDFSELTNEEQSTVLFIMTESDYIMQRRIIVEANQVDEVVSGPLVLPAKRNIVPLWIASVGSAAAAAILVFLMIQPAQVNDIKLQSVSPLVVRDTLIVENNVTDTIIDYRVVKVKETTSNPTEMTLVQIPDAVSGAANVPPIREDELVNAGVSAANDRSIAAFKVQPFIGM